MIRRFGMARRWAGILAGGVMLMSAQNASASLLGSVVGARYLSPDMSTVVTDLGASTVTTSTVFNFADLVSVGFTSTGVVVTDLTPGAFNMNAFNGLDLTVRQGPAITSASIDPSSTTAFSAGSVLSFTGTDLFLNLSGTCGTCVGGEKIVLDVNPGTPIPEPATLGLLAAGLAFATLRRRAAA